MSDVVRQSADIAQQLAERRGCRIEFRLPGEPCLAEMDRRRVERILRNLLCNAVEHGEGRDVVVTSAADRDAVAVAVRDFGVGLSPGEEHLVFDRFWRADPARARTTGGTGLGLSIALEDARLHGGWLEAWGSPARGSVFRLTLPRIAGAPLAGSPLPLVPDGADVDNLIVPEAADLMSSALGTPPGPARRPALAAVWPRLPARAGAAADDPGCAGRLRGRAVRGGHVVCQPAHERQRSDQDTAGKRRPGPDRRAGGPGAARPWLDPLSRSSWAYLAASASFGRHHGVARDYLSHAFARGTCQRQRTKRGTTTRPKKGCIHRWSPGWGATVVDSPKFSLTAIPHDVVTGGPQRAGVTVGGQRFSTLVTAGQDQAGSVVVAPASTEFHFSLVFQDGEWRIDSVDESVPGKPSTPAPRSLLLLTRPDFERDYLPRNIYYFSANSATPVLVPDPVYIPQTGLVAEVRGLVSALLQPRCTARQLRAARALPG